ncbi:MAG: thioredoxin-dependent thiol peroxidase [Bacteriovoracaceae bacterium]|nr:thioredoxin-dependent thiol peroxidase [Bacteriovoracaceae bacterium]
MAILKKGDKAPDFTLLNQKGEKINLKDFKGKKIVLLYFYPKAMTSGCTVQACELKNHKRKFTTKDVEILAVSPDAVVRLAKFSEKEALNFSLLSDEDHAVSEKYGVWGKKKLYGREYMGILRTSFLIGKDGKIQEVLEKVNTKTHHQDVLDLISK